MRDGISINIGADDRHKTDAEIERLHREIKYLRSALEEIEKRAAFLGFHSISAIARHYLG